MTDDDTSQSGPPDESYPTSFSLFDGFSPGDRLGTYGPVSVGKPLSDDAPATIGADDADGWWGIASSPSDADTWRTTGSSLLESLERVSSKSFSATDIPPWKPGYELGIQGIGGLVNKERRRYTFVGREGRFANLVRRNRTVTADTHDTRVDGHQSVTIARPADPPRGLGASWGCDRLTVHGDAEYEFKDRTLMMAGTVTRNWNGSVMRLASMEGVVCGGLMTRVIVGPAMTMTPLMNGDVYGGIVRAAAIRTYLAVLQYRAAKAAAWAIGLWVRRTMFTIVPVVPVPPESPASSAGRAAKKMSRLSKTARKAMKVTKKVVAAGQMVCPLIDILVGLVTLPLAIYSFAMLIKGLIQGLIAHLKGKAAALPPPGPPRLLNSNSGMTLEAYMSKTFT